MVRWVLERGAQVVIDPGCGSGRFALRALALDRRVRAVAVDVDPIATLLTRASLAVRQETRAIVLNGDYTTVRLPDCDGRRAAFIGNPPYVRHHALSSQTKARARTDGGIRRRHDHGSRDLFSSRTKLGRLDGARAGKHRRSARPATIPADRDEPTRTIATLVSLPRRRRRRCGTSHPGNDCARSPRTSDGRQ